MRAGGIRRNFVIYVFAGTKTKLRVVQWWGLRTECFLRSPAFIVLQALCSAWGCCLFLHTRTKDVHTQTHTHMHAPFMWESWGQVWISLSPRVTLDNALNICSLPCPNSVLAQAESRGLENPRAAAAEVWCDPLFYYNDSVNACRPETWPIQMKGLKKKTITQAQGHYVHMTQRRERFYS